MKRLSIFAVTFLIFMGCNGKYDNPVGSLSLDNNSVKMKIGDSWLYKRLFISIGLSVSSGIPDTLTGYSYFKAVKDTLIDSMSYLIIEGRDYEIEKDTIVIYKKRSAIHFSDTAVLKYEFRTGDDGFISDVLKKTGPKYYLSKTNYGTTMLKKTEMQKISAAVGYDVNVYSDFVFPIIFPLIKDSIYTYRDSMDSNGNLPYRRKFLGIEDVSTPIGNDEAYKFEWLVKESVGVENMYGFDWIGKNGLLKRYWYGTIEITDELDGVITVTDTCQAYDILEKIGTRDINPDTLVPWGKERH